MLPFDLWGESFIFIIIFSVILLVPCILVALIGRKMIDKLGQYPTQTPVIQMSIFIKLVILEVIAFAALLGFYNIFQGKV